MEHPRWKEKKDQSTTGGGSLSFLEINKTCKRHNLVKIALNYYDQ